jgi:hypothetical protein
MDWKAPVSYGDCGWLATYQDEAMLAARGHLLAPFMTRSLAVRTGQEVADELNGRLLLRYVPDSSIDEVSEARAGIETFVTPTPYAVRDLSHYLALPMPDIPRNSVIMIDPRRVKEVRGPQRVLAGAGIEYVLTAGYDADAVVGPPWAVRVR